MSLYLPDMPMKAAPHIMDQIQPRKKNQTVPIWRRPIQKLMHIVPTLLPPSAPGLPQQNTAKPAMIVPGVG